LTFSPILRRVAGLFAVALVFALYLADLTGMGMYGPDEPRYADIGRAMAQSGDWVTPRLWGHPWFEKPALLYWMTAAGFRLGLSPDLAPRLPVAVLSVLFLCFFWWRLRVEWGARAASYSTAMLATSAGWLTYSHVAVTDVPMAVFFSAAVLLSFSWIARRERDHLPAAAACLGLAALAKGLVPLVLFLPVLAMPLFQREGKRLRDWLRPTPVLAFLVCALPWYILVTLRNGNEFLRVFFLEQHFSRFRSTALQHVQPPWFYVPALLLLLYPWFPLLAFPSIAFPKESGDGSKRDPRVLTLAAVVLFGFFFFSASVNKLYGYLVPLLPAAFALLGLGLSRAKRPAATLIAPLVVVGLLPVASSFAPRLLGAHGMSYRNLPWVQVSICLLAASLAGALLARYAPRQVFSTAAFLAAIGFLWFQFATFPALDSAGSARHLWLTDQPSCAPAASRDTLYGLNYYSGRPLSPCAVLDPGSTRVVR
jgi:4-amino-4-deoxy-L-arabinose transferase-like glycosyltransferase